MMNVVVPSPSNATSEASITVPIAILTGSPLTIFYNLIDDRFE